jgi:hypothetical protein
MLARELIEDYTRELPDLVHGREGVVREHVTVPPDHAEDGPLNIYTLTPERVRRRTPEEWRSCASPKSASGASAIAPSTTCSTSRSWHRKMGGSTYPARSA